MERTQVVIAGAGPVGTVAGYYLAKAGIDVVVLEAGAATFPDLRASTYHPPTLEMLDELGVLEEMIPQGLKAPVYQFRDRHTNKTFEFDLGELEGVLKYPFRLQCEQFKMTSLLAERINATPSGRVEFNHRIVSFTQNDTGVDIQAETPMEIKHYRADYLIAADGASSIVRKWLGIEFEGFSYPEKFLCFSTKWPLEDHFPDLSYVNYISDPDEWVVLLRVPTVWRCLVPADMNTPDEELTSDANKNAVFERLIGEGPAVETEHRTIYRVHQRVAKEFVRGRVMLVGDAAHVNNPLGGLGMNSGIHDAWNLCGKLVEIFQQGAEAKPLLDRYEHQRRAITRKSVQDQTIRNKKLMELNDPAARAAYSEEMACILEDDDKRHAFLLKQSLALSLKEEAAIA